MSGNLINDYGTQEERRAFTESFRDKLNAISPSFCVAKWKQVTVHLHNGQTHSCHHNPMHPIPIEEIKIDSSALHNTKYKMQHQQMMLKGERPTDCNYCWKIEDADPLGLVFSDRVMKSIDSWANPFIDEIVNNPDKAHNPSSLEVSFSSTCNFKCSYCGPEVSSKWMEEIRQYGEYPTSEKFNNIQWLESSNRIPYLEKDINPYVDAFWEWLPELYPSLKILRITGGEPLLTKHTFTMMEYILKNPRPDLDFAINSNLVVPEKLFSQFIKLAKQIQDANAVKSFKVYTSCEATGARAEYIRFGLNYSEWLANSHKLMQEIPRCKLFIMSAYNALSITSFTDFLKDMLEFRLAYTSENDRHPNGIDIPYLRWPTHQTIEILPDEYRSMIQEQVQFMQDNLQQTHIPELCGRGFYDYEVNRMSRILNVFDNRTINKTHQKDFAIFVDEHDYRRGTNFLKTFPEMEPFYKYCKSL